MNNSTVLHFSPRCLTGNLQKRDDTSLPIVSVADSNLGTTLVHRNGRLGEEMNVLNALSLELEWKKAVIVVETKQSKN